jgi:hypothetical protein
VPGRDAADAVARLAQALQDRDLNAGAALFERDACLQQGNGALRRGDREIRAALEQAMDRDRASVRYCTRLDEGSRSALELQLFEDRPALVVCTRGASGGLCALRWYA